MGRAGGEEAASNEDNTGSASLFRKSLQPRSRFGFDDKKPDRVNKGQNDHMEL